MIATGLIQNLREDSGELSHTWQYTRMLAALLKLVSNHHYLFFGY